jgi:hypothetical protein
MKKENNDIVLNKLKLELEELNKRYNNDELELTYYNVKETIIDFFEKMTIEEKRTSLIKIIKNCQIFNKYIVIETGNILFIFNVNEEYKITEDVYNKFKKDKKFKDNFFGSSKLIDSNGVVSKMVLDFSKSETEKYSEEEVNNFIISVINFFNVRVLGNLFINEYYLKNIDMRINMKKKMDKLGIKYKLLKIEKIVSFTEL